MLLSIVSNDVGEKIVLINTICFPHFFSQAGAEVARILDAMDADGTPADRFPTHYPICIM